MNNHNPLVDPVFKKAGKWKTEMTELRSVLHQTGLKEELKWRQACYTLDSKNIAIISSFKDYCVLSFFKGVLLNDPKKILSTPGANSQSVRMIKFTSVDEIRKLKTVIKSYVKEAMKNETEGIKVRFKKITEHKIPKELQDKFKENPDFKTAFKSLTPGRQRGYILFFSSAKQPETRRSRIEKHLKKIFNGKGLNDR